MARITSTPDDSTRRKKPVLGSKKQLNSRVCSGITSGKHWLATAGGNCDPFVNHDSPPDKTLFALCFGTPARPAARCFNPTIFPPDRLAGSPKPLAGECLLGKVTRACEIIDSLSRPFELPFNGRLQIPAKGGPLLHDHSGSPGLREQSLEDLGQRQDPLANRLSAKCEAHEILEPLH